jgi:DNA repair protein RadC
MPDAELFERIRQQGIEALSHSELLAVILRIGGADEDALTLAERLLSQSGGLRGLARCDYADLLREFGLRPAQAAQVVAAMTLGQRLARSTEDPRPVIESSEDAARLLLPEMEKLKQEQLRAVLLDASRRVMHIATIYIGSLNMTVVRVAEVFREPIARNAASLILAHNHPSGDPTPSPADLALTESLIQAGHLLDIPLLDHLIIGHGRWTSLRDTGLGFG